MENEKKEMTIKEKIDALQLVPLFPDTNYFIGKDENANGVKITNDSIAFSYSRPEANLFMTGMMSRKVNSKEYTRLFVVIKENTRVYEDISDDNQREYLDNLPELLNKYNEYYEITAKLFNQELMKTIKDELEKEKQKQQEKEEQEKQEQEEKGEQEKSEEQEQSEEEGEGEESEEDGEDGDGEDGDGEDGDGEDGDGEEGDGDGKEMTSEEIQKMIDDITKDQNGEGQQGQSDNKGDEIDLEDFLNEVEKGNADNDFGSNYNNQELKGQIDYDKQQQGEPIEPNGQEQPRGMPQDQKYSVTNVLGSVKEMFNTNDEDIKRRFPNPTSISDFIDALSKAKIDELADRVGLPTDLSNLEKTKQIKTNLITEIQNI